MVMPESDMRAVEAEIVPWQVVSNVLKDIEETYGRKRKGKVRSQRDSLRLATASVLEIQHSNLDHTSEYGKSAIEAVNGALLNDWKPMKDFLGMSVTAARLGKLFGGAEQVDVRHPIENLLASL